jgi:ATP-dependent DNA ligase
VGGGFSDLELRQIKDMLSNAPKVSPPFDIGEPYTAVKTSLKVKVKYYKTTEEGKLRHPTFLGTANETEV